MSIHVRSSMRTQPSRGFSDQGSSQVYFQVVAEKSLTKKKVYRQTNIITEKAKTIYPLYTSYRGYKERLRQACANVVFVFNVPPTAKVIWRRGHGLKSHPTDW